MRELGRKPYKLDFALENKTTLKFCHDVQLGISTENVLLCGELQNIY